MSLDVLARHTLSGSDRHATGMAADLLKRRGTGDHIEVLLVRADGTREGVAMPAAAAGLIGDLLDTASAGGAMALLHDDSEISPEDAASILGISRPLVRRRMEIGQLPFRLVGTHRRIRLEDVLALKRREAPMRAALEALNADTEDLLAQGL